MVNVEKHISYWLKGAIEDWEVSSQLIQSNKVRHGLFFLHLSFEKVLKAHICKKTQDIAPKLHNLVRLLKLSKISLNQKEIDILAELNPFNIEGRYPETWYVAPTKKEALQIVEKVKDLFACLKNQLQSL